MVGNLEERLCHVIVDSDICWTHGVETAYVDDDVGY